MGDDPALLYGLVPSLILGRRKQPLAEELHDKVLYADARMNRADWLTAGAAILGILGIGIGLWWADAVAALVIAGTGWIDGSAIRLREYGHNITGEIWVVPSDDADLPGCADELRNRIEDLDWRLHELAVIPVDELEDVPEDLRTSA